MSVKSEDFNNKLVEQIHLLTYCRCSIYNIKSCWSCKFKKSIIELKGKVPTFRLARKNPQPFRKFVFIFPTLALDKLLKDAGNDKDKKPKIGDQEGGDSKTRVSVFRAQPEKSFEKSEQSVEIVDNLEVKPCEVSSCLSSTIPTQKDPKYRVVNRGIAKKP